MIQVRKADNGYIVNVQKLRGDVATMDRGDMGYYDYVHVDLVAKDKEEALKLVSDNLDVSA